MSSNLWCFKVLIAVFVSIGMVLLVSCSTDEDVILPNDTSTPPNILLIIADDMGLDACPGYDIGNLKPNMPNLQKMINEGVRFTNVWANPVCTPTRATLLTGKYGFRTNVQQVGDDISLTENTIQSYISDRSDDYTHALIGKWHLSDNPSDPTSLGIDHYAGMLTGGVRAYDDWNYTHDGTTENSNEYITSQLSNLAIEWVNQQTNNPWFLWLAYTAPHTPFHLPPAALHTQSNLSGDINDIDSDPLSYYLAMIEAMDTEMGRVIQSIDDEDLDNTIIIFLGDNGTQNSTSQAYPSRRSKGTIYQGGINVPMIISGAGVNRSGELDHSLINTTDLFGTIADIAVGYSDELLDSKSFKNQLSQAGLANREYVFAERGTDNNKPDQTIRNITHKYILFSNNDEALYDLIKDPFELTNLLSDAQLPLSSTDGRALELLKAELSNLLNN